MKKRYQIRIDTKNPSGMVIQVYQYKLVYQIDSISLVMHIKPNFITVFSTMHTNIP